MNRSRFSKRTARWTGLRALASDTSGIAAVEFALIVPFMLVLYMGTVEISQLLAVDRRISTVSSAVGDLVARIDGDLPSATLNDYFAAAELTMTPYQTGNLKQVVSSVYVDVNGDATINWSYGYNGGNAHTVGAVYDLPSEITDIASDAYVIVSEAAYSYQPLLGWVFEAPLTLYEEFFHLPRYGANIDIT